MTALLDENLPAELAGSFSRIAVYHVEHLGLKGAKNGVILEKARSDFDLLISCDKGLLHQHHHVGHGLRILVLRLADNRLETLRSLASAIEDEALSMAPGELRAFGPQ